MEKEIKINYGYVSGEYLVLFFEKGLLKKWEIAHDSKVVGELISKYYHG